jgi:hypothetical protein
MMKHRKLIALVGLICCSVPWVEAHAGIGIGMLVEPTHASASKKPVKRLTESVVRPDGRVVDRLAEFNSAKSISSGDHQDAVPATPEAWLSRMLDPTKNGLVAKHPELLAEWLDAITEPRFMTALASVAMSPDTYANTLGKMVDPATVRNWSELADPQIMLRWMMVGSDPAFYKAIYDRMTDSSKLRRWGIDPVSNKASAARDTTNARDKEWLHLPVQEATGNPWLLNTANYRY